MFSRGALGLVLIFAVCGCAARPKSELGQEIYQLMLENEAVTGPTALNDELCDLVSEQSLNVAVEEFFGGWTAMSGLVGKQFADVPEGTTWASFSRPVEWFFRTQTVWIEINTGAGFCEAHVRIKST